MTTVNEKSLIALLQETGDGKVADVLFKPYIASVRRFLLARGALQSDADDLVQETLLTAFLKINQFRGQSSFSTWLTRIAFRKFIDSRRQASRIKRLFEKFSAGAGTATGAAGAIEFERYEQLLEQLSMEQQNVFLCCDWLGHSHEEAARFLKLPLGSVKTYLKQARDSLNRKVGD